MLNYISAELYKVTHRKYPYIFLGLILACIAFMTFGFTAGFRMEESEYFMSSAEFLSILVTLFSTGFFLCAIVGDMVFSDQYKHNTLKNEVSFGMSRTRIYLGKLITEIIVAVVLCTIIIGVYFICAKLFFPASPEDGLMLQILGRTLLAQIPLWVGGLALVHLTMFSFKSSMIAVFVYLGVILMGGNVCSMMMHMPNPVVAAIFTFLNSILITTPSDMLRQSCDWPLVARAWMTGMGWLAGTSVLGLVLFNKREIN
ncbi:MAG: ABC transporter permease [Oscillospiraceae bacterium]